MDNNNLKRQWKDLISHQIKRIAQHQDDSDISIQIQSQPSKIKQHDNADNNALTFWLNRKKFRNEEKVINLDDNKPQIGKALNSIKYNTATNKSIQPIGPHRKQREKQTVVPIINLQNQSKKNNLQTYKKAIFSNKDRHKPIVVQSSEEVRNRMQKQMQIINDMNKPRWMLQKQKRNEINKMKYPISNTTSYSYQAPTRSNNFQKFNEYTWRQYERKQQEIRLKNRGKLQQQRKKERQKKEEQKEKKRLQQIAEYQSLFDGILGIQPKKKQKLQQASSSHHHNQQTNQRKVTQNQRVDNHINNQDNNQVNRELKLQKGEILQGIIQSQNSQDQNQNNQMGKSRQTYSKKKQNRYGLSDIIKPYQSIAPNFINIILHHNFSVSELPKENKRIPDIFEDQSVYKKIFHYLIINQCIAGLTQKISHIEKGGSDQPIKIIISKVRANNDSQTQIMLKEVGNEDNKSIKLKSMSLSKYRLGLITSKKQYRRQFYGIQNNSPENYAFIVMLMTPQNKEELGLEVKGVCGVAINELQWIIMNKRSNQAYYYDLQKISTFVRQYLAVSNFIYSQLAPAVLNPQILQKQMCQYVQNKDCLNDILISLKNIFNDTQWQSIREMVLIERGIVLLQGPPGTGKTSTLMGLLSAQYQYLKRIGDNRKIMICAPSNAAVDHIVKRIKTQGLFNGEGEIIKPNILRVGIVDSQDPDILEVYLDNLCEKKMIEQQQNAKKFNNLTTPQIKERLILIQKELRLLKPPNTLIDEKKKQIILLQNYLYSFRQQKCVLNKRKYNQFQTLFFNQAQIILTTLSSSGNQKIDKIRGQIACLIIDEAAQATQPNLLIAFQTGVSKVILIGDPYQLPATCISTDCNVTLYNRSLFQRFIDANIKPYFLNIQYRMAPMIRHFPSLKFYNNRLIDSQSVLKRPLPKYIQLFEKRNVIFVDLKYSQQSKKGDSYCNQYQAQVVGLLVYCLFDQNITLGVITPYQAQKKSIQRTIKHQCKSSQDSQSAEARIFKNVMINTVDSFQGQEKDIIIVSTARSNEKKSLGFLTDERRINVTLTRAKSLLIVVGNGNTLGSNEIWNDFLLWTEQQKVYYQIHKKQGYKNILSKVFQQYNQKPIKRYIHNKLSTDPRNIHRHEIESKDFMKNKKNKNIIDTSSVIFNPQNDEPRQINQRNIILQKENQKKILSQQQSTKKQVRNKFALDIKESQMIVESKRKKEKEAQQFEELNLRMKILQEQMSKQRLDPAYKQLFQLDF